jgi:hypothetical protein
MMPKRRRRGSIGITIKGKKKEKTPSDAAVTIHTATAGTRGSATTGTCDSATTSIHDTTTSICDATITSGSNDDYKWLDVQENVNQLVEDERRDPDPLLEKSAWKVAVAYLFVNFYDAPEEHLDKYLVKGRYRLKEEKPCAFLKELTCVIFLELFFSVRMKALATLDNKI